MRLAFEHPGGKSWPTAHVCVVVGLLGFSCTGTMWCPPSALRRQPHAKWVKEPASLLGESKSLSLNFFSSPEKGR